MLTIHSFFYNLVGLASASAFHAAGDNDYIAVTTVEFTPQGVVTRTDEYPRRLWEIDPT